MTARDLKHIPCPKCGGVENVYGAPTQRTILYFADEVRVRCNNSRCGDVLTFPKIRARKETANA